MRMVLLVLCLCFFAGSAQCQEEPEPILRSYLMPTYPPIAATAHVDGRR